MIALRRTLDGVLVPVRVRASAGRNGVAGEHDGAVCIQVTTAPEKGRANAAVAKVLSEVLQTPRSAVQLATGAASRNKQFLVTGVDLDYVRDRVAAAIGS